MKLKINVPHVYKDVFSTDRTEIFLYSPRAAGKSFVAADLAITYMLKYPHHDIVMARCNAVNLRNSVYAEMVSRIKSMGLEDKFKCTTSPCRITTATNTIHFAGVGGSDSSRTRSFQSVNRLSLYIVDEVQQIGSRETLEQASSSYIRHLDSHIASHAVYISNPPDGRKGTAKGWVLDFLDEKEMDRNALVIKTTYLDIKGLLNPLLLKDIAAKKEYNNKLYRKIYLGEIDATDGVAMYNYNDSYLVPHLAEPIQRMYVGVDVGVAKDCTSAIPIALTTSGKYVVLEEYIHVPANGLLTQNQQAAQIKRHINKLCDKYGFNPYYQPIAFVVDCAAVDMILSLRQLGLNTLSFTDKKTASTIETVNNMFGQDMIRILNSNKKLINEILSNTFIDGKLDPKIPNDSFDAFRYIMYWLSKQNTRT